MSYAIQIQASDLGGASAIKSWLAAVQPRQINAIFAKAAAESVRNHLFQKNSEPNKSGWPKQNLYAQMARSVNFTASDSSATVNINHVAAAQRYFGGDIKPVNGSWLTIPATPEAYGKRAREFPQLRFGVVKNQWGCMQAALIDSPRTEVKIRKAKAKVGGYVGAIRFSAQEGVSHLGNKVYFWLTKLVNQKRDLTVLPTQEELTAACLQAGRSHLARVAGGAQ